MSTITSAQAGKWSATSTWTGGAVPTAADDVELLHHVTVDADFSAKDITVKTGGGISVELEETLTGARISSSDR